MGNQTLDRDILDAVRSVEVGANTERNRTIAIRYFGFDGKGGCSMQEAGSPYGLTRESVRQITNKVAEHVKDRIKNTELIQKSLDVINESLPASAKDIESNLTELGIIGAPYCIEGVLNAAKIVGLDTSSYSVTKHNKSRFVVKDNQIKCAQDVESLAISEISHNGAVSMDNLGSVVLSDNSVISRRFAKAVMMTIPETLFVDKEENWAIFQGRGRNRFIKRLDQVFSVFKTVDINDLEESISRNWRKNKNENTKVLPKEVMLSIAASLGSYTVKEGTITCQGSKKSDGSVKEFERKILDLLKESEDGTRREKELEDALVKNKNDKWNFSVALNYCPLFIRQSRGMYKLAGIPW